MFELNDETRWILGRPNFTCPAIANLLRKNGHDIPNKSEEEQAATIYCFLTMYEKHGDNWREKVKEDLENIFKAMK